jgi:hypothetical protein
MGSAAVCLGTGTEVHHSLVGVDCSREAPLLHEDIPEKAIVVSEAARCDQLSRQGLGLAEAMHIDECVPPQEQSIGSRNPASAPECLHAESALFGELVVARIVRGAGLFYIFPAELLEGLRWIVSLFGIALQSCNLFKLPARAPAHRVAATSGWSVVAGRLAAARKRRIGLISTEISYGPSMACG